MGRIRCGNCGGVHQSVVEVRACHLRPPNGPGPPNQSESRADRPEAPPTPPDPPLDPAGLAGPDPLGRSLVIGPGQETPEPWLRAPRFVVDDSTIADPDPTIGELQPLWSRRTRFVVELRAVFDEPPAEREDRPPWRLDPSHCFARERLWHLVFSNAVDGRDPDRPRFAPRDEARRAGCAPSPVMDVLDRAGGPAWCDGGPLASRVTDPTHRPGAAPLLPTVVSEHGFSRALVDVEPTADLAADQLAAVRHQGGPCRVISPAGSGKTRTLTERARHLLGDWGLPPSALLLVAFNVRAAREMRERTADLPSLHIRTLNSLGLAILTGRGPFRPPNPAARALEVTEERGARDLLHSLVDFPRRANTDPVAPWLEALTRVRLGLRSPQQVEEEYGGDIEGFAAVFDRYRDQLHRRNTVDFDEQVYGAVELLLRRADVRHVAQRACRVMLVDEFQDLTPAHLLLIRLLAAPRFDVFGVGDDDQTIYGYNGADPRWLIDYEDYFPGGASHPLTINYRCDPAVVRAADQLLTHNRRRVGKRILPRPGRKAGATALRVERSDETVPATVAAVRRAIDAGAAPDDVVVLCRVNATLAPVQLALGAVGIAVDPATDAQWLRRTGVRSTLAWVRLATDPRGLRAADLQTTARRPPRGLAPKVIEWLAEQRDLTAIDRLAGRLRDRDAEKVQAYADDLRELTRLAGDATTADLIRHIGTVVGLDRAMRSLDGARRGVDRSTHTDDLDALLQLARLHPDPASFEGWLTDQLRSAPQPAPRVHLSTVHRVKGLEWPHVIVHEASDRLLPHRLADDREEERRIFHVALTRSTETTTVVAPSNHPSPFLDELAERAAPAAAAPSGPPARGRSRTPPGAQASEAAGPPDERTDELEGSLRAWRRERARGDGIPAYRILTDRTLVEIAARRPVSYAELSACHGIGPAKLEDFGDEVLALVAEAG